MSSADGWLVEGESPKQAPGLCREKRRPKTGEGRAYTQNPATAQARRLRGQAGVFPVRRRLRNSEGPRLGRESGGEPAGRSVTKARAALDRPRVEL